MSRSPLRIVVSGLVAQYPVGGVAWDYLQYVIGLNRLGHDVYYWEDTWSWPYHPVQRTYTDDPSYSASFLAEFFQAYSPDMVDKWCYYHLHEHAFGMSKSAFDEVAASADLLINVSGAGIPPDALSPRCHTVFIDTDPGYNQIVLRERPSWSENVDRWDAEIRAHDSFATYAENIHDRSCLVPDVGLAWDTTRMPVVLDLWERVGATPPGNAWSTVLTWNAFKGELTHEGVTYHSKNTEFERLIELPSRVSPPLIVALGGVDAPSDRISRHGWTVVDGPAATRTPSQYQDLIAGSRAEISPAKHVYVALRTGWFSCRSACYLAAGRPVVVQDTGFRGILPTGLGIVPFSTVDEAADGIREVEANYERHSRAARDIAEEYFDSSRVLTSLIERAFSSATVSVRG